MNRRSRWRTPTRSPRAARSRSRCLANDVDPDSTLVYAEVIIAAQPSHGSAVVGATGIEYTHNGSETTADSFTYKVNDGALDSDIITVSITVTPVNDAPAAMADTDTVAEGGMVSVAVLANDVDPDSTLSYAEVIIAAQPSHGSAVMGATGIEYTHDGSETTADSFTYWVNDGSGDSNTVTVSITVTPVNDVPFAVADADTVAEGGTVLVAVLANDSDPDSTLAYANLSLQSAPTNGIAVVDATGVTYTHDGSETSTDSFTYRVNDGSRDSSTVTVSITVTPVNDAPVALADTSTVGRGATVSVAVLANDVDPDSTLAYAGVNIVAQPSHGTAVVGATGVTYTHDGSETTADSFTYQVSDGALDSDIVTVSITVTPFNDSPVAVADVATVAEGGTVSVAVLANDTDPDSTLAYASVSIQTLPTNGSAVVGATGVTYTHDGSETTADSFTYRVNDGFVDSNTVTVAITVTPANDAPVAIEDLGTVAEGASLSVAVLANDVDPDSTLAYTNVVLQSQPSHGTAVVGATGVTYTHDGSEGSTDAFTYQVNDGSGDSNTVTVSITVTPVNDVPAAIADTGTVAEGGTVVVAVLANDLDPDSTLTYTNVSLMSAPTNGIAVMDARGVKYTHNGSETSSDAFTYQVKDGSGDSNTVTVSITVTPIDDAPSAVADSDAVAEGGTVSVAVLANDIDTDSTLAYANVDIASAPANGIAVVGATGVTYTHNGSETSTDAFTYRVNDGSRDSNTVTVSITVTPVNDAPVAVADTSTVAEGGTVLVAVLANDLDPDSTLGYTNVSLASAPTNGIAVVGAAGITYTHNGSETNADAFTYRVNDGSLDSNTVTVSIAVTPVDDAPVALANDPYTIAQGLALALDASGSADPEGPLARFEWDCTDDGVFDVSDNAGTGLTCTYAEVGSYTARLRVTDLAGRTAETTAAVTVGNVDPVITSSPPLDALEGALWTYAAVAVDPGAARVWSLSAGAPVGMAVAATGIVTWTPTYEQAVVGAADVDLIVADGNGGTDSERFTITVATIDDDADGIPDTWESDNGLDPDGPSDAALDADNDGLTNLQEWQQGTDPASFDGPSTPVLRSPIGRIKVSTSTPTLSLTNAIDPQDEALTYELEVYAEEALTTRLDAAVEVAGDPSGTTSWTVSVPLAENTVVWWRARASDPWTSSPWTAPESFLVDVTNEAPEPPVLVYPVDDARTSRQPTLTWSLSADPEGDEVTYDVELRDLSGSLVTSAEDVAGGNAEGQWTVDKTLDEGGAYTWRARAVDSDGLQSDWSDEAPFRSGDTNAAPTGVAFVTPLDGDEVADVSQLEASAGADPEGSALSYHFELDTVATFDGVDLKVADLPGGTDPIVWDLAEVGIVLPAGTTWFARVQATDSDGIGSVPDTIRFAVADAPDDTDPGAGCGCESGPGGSAAMILLVATMLGLRRRRR